MMRSQTLLFPGVYIYLIKAFRKVEIAMSFDIAAIANADYIDAMYEKYKQDPESGG